MPSLILEDGIRVFDLSQVHLVDTGEFNDFDVTYLTADSCDLDVWVFNQQTREWMQIGVNNLEGGCFDFPTWQKHLFSAKGVIPENCVDDDGKLLLRGTAQPRLRALKLHSGYKPIPAAGRAFTFHRNMLLVAASDALRWYSLSGELLEEVPVANFYASGIAADGDRIWMIRDPNEIFLLEYSLDFQCSFTQPDYYPGGLAWGERKLWMSEASGTQRPRTFVVEPNQSCRQGEAAVVWSFETPGGGAQGIAFDGQNLMILSDRLYKVTIYGKVLSSYEIPVYNASDLCWYDDSLWVLHRGIDGVRSSETVVARFQVP